MKVFPAIYLYCILELVIHVIKHPSNQISVKINEVIGFVSCFISPSKAFLKDSLKTLLNFKRLCQDTLKLPSKILITFSFQLNKNRPNYDLKTIFLSIKKNVWIQKHCLVCLKYCFVKNKPFASWTLLKEIEVHQKHGLWFDSYLGKALWQSNKWLQSTSANPCHVQLSYWQLRPN